MGSISKKISISGNFDTFPAEVAILKSSSAELDEVAAELVKTSGVVALDVTDGTVVLAGVAKLEVLAADDEATAAVARLSKLEESSAHPGVLRGSCDR